MLNTSPFLLEMQYCTNFPPPPVNTKDLVFYNLCEALGRYTIINFAQNFILDNYVGKQETEVGVDSLVHGIELNELLLIDYSSCFVS